jgi:hypothetical protein
VAVSLLWMAVAPIYAQGLGLIGKLLIPVLEAAPDVRYSVEGGRLLAHRPTWLPQQKRTAPLVWPLWVAAANYGVPLLAALILATPGWRWGRRGRALALGLGLLTLTQIAFVLVTIVATQQSPVMSPDGMIQVAGFGPIKQRVFYALYYFFDLMGRGFFALLIYLGLIGLGWNGPEPVAPRPAGRRVGRNEPCPCGSGLKYKRCCQA